MIEHEGKRYELVDGDCSGGDHCDAPSCGRMVKFCGGYGKILRLIPEAPQPEAGNESSFATTYPTIELRGVETNNDMIYQIRKIQEEVDELSVAIIGFLNGKYSLQKVAGEAFDIITATMTFLVKFCGGLKYYANHTAKMDARGWKADYKKEGD